MAEDKTTTTVVKHQYGPGFFGLLTLIFVIAKLTGHLDWTWFWVFAPIWIPFAVVAVVMLIMGVLALIAAVILD